MPAPTRRIEVTAIGLATHAREFKEAADALVAGGEQPDHAMAIHYLYGHAIELALKAFLRHREVPSSVLRHEIGHDLVALVRRVFEVDPTDRIGIAGERRLLIESLGGTYGLNGFEYRIVPESVPIPYGELAPVAGHVVDRVTTILRSARRS
ncbi:MAG TPA: hypothetical protein VEA81_08990 [Burkholderiaceae bacterium]|nr:hypothetical protein [Burkholderiaceae bacterium]